MNRDISSQVGQPLLKEGDPAPDFTLPTHNEGELNLAWYQGRQNVVLAFYPGDFTPVCSAQIPAYQDVLERFEQLNTKVLGISVDSLAVHDAWAKSMGGLAYPLMSDFYPHGEVAKKYGVFDEKWGVAQRTVFLIDKEGIIRYIERTMFSDLPSNDELFRRIEALEE
jgi:peroxiredoxin (alkyl hydroperoxide reductase subunit C)